MLLSAHIERYSGLRYSKFTQYLAEPEWNPELSPISKVWQIILYTQQDVTCLGVMVHSSKSQSLPGYMFINDWLSCDLQCNMVFTTKAQSSQGYWVWCWFAVMCCAMHYSVFLLSSKSMQYGLRWLKSIFQRWGPGSRRNHLLASYITPTKRSNAFSNFLKMPNFKQIGKCNFFKGSAPIISKFGFFKIPKKSIGSICWCDIGSQEVIQTWPRTSYLRTGPYPSYTVNWSGWPCENAKLYMWEGL